MAKVEIDPVTLEQDMIELTSAGAPWFDGV
jgi:hypothetical protein